MRILFLSFMILFFASVSNAAELYSPTPQCAMITNATSSTLFVMVRTDYYKNQDGSKDRFESSLRLNPSASQQVCAKGPFYPNYKVDLSIRTLIPIFSCKTKLVGEIKITSTKRSDDSTGFMASCVD